MIFAEIIFVDEKCWFEMLNKILIKVLFEMLIEILIDDLMGFVRAASDADTSDALTGFPILPKNCNWLWNNQMHWRIYCVFVKRLHLTLRRSNALTDFRWCQENCILMLECTGGFSILPKNCIWRWNDQMHWRVFDFCQKTASDSETIRCTDGLTMVSLF